MHIYPWHCHNCFNIQPAHPEHLLSMLLPDGKKRGPMRVNPATVIFTDLIRNDVKVKSCNLFSNQSAMMGTSLKFITCELQNLQPIPGIIDDCRSNGYI